MQQSQWMATGILIGILLGGGCVVFFQQRSAVMTSMRMLDANLEELRALAGLLRSSQPQRVLATLERVRWCVQNETLHMSH